ncbi:MAG: helix-turn-helix domain-containing protein [Dysgonamonadaceae bacterium]|nr:helix-turn-helix domain-containing protein [Dysgonamonadaceae bacterium]
MNEIGMNQTRFAKETGINSATLSQLFNDAEGRNPTLDMVIKVLKRFEDVNCEWLLCGTEPMYRSERLALKIEDEAGRVEDLFNHQNLVVNASEEVTVNAQKNIAQNSAVRKIDRITVYYDDGKFEDFFQGK